MDGIDPDNPPFPEFAPPDVSYPKEPPLDSPAPSTAAPSLAANSPAASTIMPMSDESVVVVRKSSDCSENSADFPPHTDSGVESRDETPEKETTSSNEIQKPMESQMMTFSMMKPPQSNVASDFFAANPALQAMMMGGGGGGGGQQMTQYEHENMLEDLQEFIANELGPLGAQVRGSIY